MSETISGISDVLAEQILADASTLLRHMIVDVLAIISTRKGCTLTLEPLPLILQDVVVTFHVGVRPRTPSDNMVVAALLQSPSVVTADASHVEAVRKSRTR